MAWPKARPGSTKLHLSLNSTRAIEHMSHLLKNYLPITQLSWTYFLGKSVDLPTAMGMSCNSVCTCVFVYVCKNLSRRSNLGEIQKRKKDVYRFWCLQSGCDIVSVVLQLIQAQIFRMSIFRKRWELAKKSSNMKFIQVDICHWTGPFRMLYSVTFPKFSRSNFQIGYFHK